MLKLDTYRFISHAIMSANYARAVVVSTPSQFTVTQASLPSAAVNGTNQAVGHVGTHWEDSVPPEKQGVPLSADEFKQLQECEGFVKTAQCAFVDAGLALARIRDLHLYREEFRCFRDYCLERWRYGKAYSYRLIAGAQVVKWLSPAGDISPRCEWQVRPMVASNLTKDEAATVWARAVTLAEGDEPTVKHVRTSVLEIKPPKRIVKPRLKKPVSLVDVKSIAQNTIILLKQIDYFISSAQNPSTTQKLVHEAIDNLAKIG
jgi:hypothetical protein